MEFLLQDQSYAFHLELLLNNGEFEHGVLSGQLLVDSGVCLELVLGVVLVLAVQVYLQQLGTVVTDTESLADNLSGVDQVVEDGLVDGGNSLGVGADGTSNG